MPIWVTDENPLILLPFFFFVFLVCYGGSVLSRVVTGSIFYSLIISLNMMIDSARWFWIQFAADNTLLTFTIKSFLWFLISLFLRRIVPDHKPIQLSPRLWFLVGAMSLAPLFSQLSFVIHNTYRYRNDALVDAIYQFILRLAYTALPFVALTSLALLYALTMLAKYERLMEQHQLDQINRSYYEQLERQQAQVRRLRHDMANHLQALASLPDEARASYLEQLLDSPALHSARKWSDNNVVNAVLSAKAEQMEMEHIRADLSAPLPCLLPFTDVDLCALFANSLDNAIEACRKLPQAERRITLKARVDKGLFVLQVKNPRTGDLLREGGRFRTTKTDSSNHGLGLAGIESITEKYRGSMQIDLQNSDFELLLYLPLS